MKLQPHPILARKPLQLQGLLYDFWWDIEKLHALQLPIRMVEIQGLSWHLDLPYWKHDDKPFQISPRQVLENPQKYAEQYKRMLLADTRYPIIVREKDNRLLILDGVHRLLKLVIANEQTCQVATFHDELIPLIVHT